MKAILKFSLPEDQEEYIRANKALDMAGCLYSLQQYLCGLDPENYRSTEDMKEKISESFFLILEEYNVVLDEVYP